MNIINFRATYKMRKYHIQVEYKTKVPLTERTLATAEAFGVGIDEGQTFVVVNSDIDVNAGDVVYLTGDSGSGKSTILREFVKQFADQCVNIDNVDIQEDKAIVDQVGVNVEEALKILSIVGLNDAFLFLRRYSELSGGQQYRFRIAKLIESQKPVWCLDEFTSTLDRDTAKIVAWNIQKHARRLGKTLLVATCMTDLGDDLRPNVRVDKRYNEEIKIGYEHVANTFKFPCSLESDIVCEVGDKHDWEKLMVFHYRSHKIMIPMLYVRMVRRVMCPRHDKRFITEKGDNQPCMDVCMGEPNGTCYTDELVGVCVFSSPPMSVYGRALVFGSDMARTSDGLKNLNRSVRQISRVVVHPKYRSMGLGARLINEALKLSQTQWSETIAVMAKYNPFFEKAGMLRVAERPIDARTKKLMDAVVKLGWEKSLVTSETYVKGKFTELKPLQQLELRSILAINSKGPGFSDYLKQRGFDSQSPTYLTDFVQKADDALVCKLLARNALMASPKIYLVYNKEWENNPAAKLVLKEQIDEKLSAQTKKRPCKISLMVSINTPYINTEKGVGKKTEYECSYAGKCAYQATLEGAPSLCTSTHKCNSQARVKHAKT